MTTKSKLALALVFAGALTATAAMAQTAPAAAAAAPAQEFVAESPNVPQLGKPIAGPRDGGAAPNEIPVPGSLALVTAAAFAAFAVMRRRK